VNTVFDLEDQVPSNSSMLGSAPTKEQIKENSTKYDESMVTTNIQRDLTKLLFQDS
jgi:hypothetical protein